MKKNIGYFVIAYSSFLYACSSPDPLVISLSELGNSTKSDVGANGGIRLIRSINVTGLNSLEVVGSYTIDPDADVFRIHSPWGKSQIPDTLFPRISTGCKTMVMEAKFPEATLEDVIATRDGLFKLNEYQLQQTNTSMQLAALVGLGQYADEQVKHSKKKDANELNSDTNESNDKYREEWNKALEQAKLISGLSDISDIDSGIKELESRFDKLSTEM